MDFYRKLGLLLEKDNAQINYNASRSKLIEEAVANRQAQLSKDGSLVVKTGKHTGRSAGDKYVVRSSSTEDSVWWDNNLNSMTSENFQKLKSSVLDYLNEKDRNIYISENSVGAHKEHNIGVRLISTHPSHTLFANNLFRELITPLKDDDFTILHAPEMPITPSEFGTKTETIIATCFDTKTTIITGTLYAGEIKKSMFCVLNYELPEKNVLPMHAGCSELQNKEVSIFFGLSGTGKTTLSTDEGTLLIGDDEHGLSDEGVFNFEGGCYAKTYQLSSETEPEIFEASNRFGSILENVVMDEKTGVVDFFDKSISENGRSSYPLEFIEEIEPTSSGKVPSHIFFLTADAFGVLPPAAKLTKSQAMFYFVLGYTAKLAGTEIGVKEPQATFSPCFGAPFMLRHPSVYAKLLGEYLDKHDIDVWLINTGWTKGPYGEGERFPLKITREIIRSIQSNEQNSCETNIEPNFGLAIPSKVRDVPASALNPKESWADKNAYDKKAQELAKSFHSQMKNFGDFYTENIEGAPPFGKE